MFFVFAIDLKAARPEICIVKFADDCTLISPECSDADFQYEFESICRWAVNNKLMLNKTKTNEIVFHRPNPRNFNPPPHLLSIERVTHLKLLGVIIADDLSFNRHVNYIVQICSQNYVCQNSLNSQGCHLIS